MPYIKGPITEREGLSTMTQVTGILTKDGTPVGVVLDHCVIRQLRPGPMPADPDKAMRNRACVRELVARRGWTQSVGDQAEFRIEVALDRIRKGP
jgi:hypothetical protein